MENFLSRFKGVPLQELKPHLYFMHDQSAVVHLMRVAAGLDSMTFGRVMDFLVKASLSGRSMIILTSEPLPGDLPNTDNLRIANGVLE